MRRYLPLVALETTTLLSGSANAVLVIALPWLILEETGEAIGAGVVAAAQGLPLVLSLLFAGVIADRIGRRICSVGSDVLSAVSAAAISVVAAVGDLNVAAIAALAAVGAVFDPVGFTAREAMIPAVARRAGMRLERANGLHEVMFGLCFAVGPGAAGVLIAVLGAGPTLWAAAIALSVSALVMVAVRVPGAGRPRRTGPRPSVWSDAKEGVAFVWRDKILLSVAAMSLLCDGIYLPVEGVLLPVYFEQQGAPSRLGLLLFVMAAGWIAASLLYGAIGHRLPRRATLVGSALAMALSVLPLAFLPPYPVMLVAGAMLGVAYGPFNPLINLVMQVRSPEALRGRVIGVVLSVGYAAGPAGFLLSGVLIDTFGLRPAFLTVGGLLLAGAVASLFIRPLRRLDDLPVEPREQSPADLAVASVPSQRTDGPAVDVSGETSGARETSGALV